MATRRKPVAPARRKRATQPRGEETRGQILISARALFLARGFHGTSMRQIADAAGLAVGGIYNHFASKEAVFAAVLDSNHPYHIILPALEHARGIDLEAFIRDAARRVFDAVRGSEDTLMPLIFIELVEFQGRHLQDLADRLFPRILEFFQRAGEHGGQLRALPVPVVMRTLMALVIGYMMTELILRNSPFIKQMDFDWSAGMMDIFLHGALAEGHAARRKTEETRRKTEDGRTRRKTEDV